MEEVSSGYADLIQSGVVGGGEEAVKTEGDEKVVESLRNNDSKTGLKKNKIRKNEVLFVKVLFFQLIVSGFVLLTLFVLKNILPNQFRMVSSQLRVAIDEGPKFYDGFDSTLREVRNFVRREKAVDTENSNLNEESNISVEGDRVGDVATRKNVESEQDMNSKAKNDYSNDYGDVKNIKNAENSKDKKKRHKSRMLQA